MRIVLLSLLLACMSLGAQTPPQSDLDRAREHFQQGKLQDARGILERLAKTKGASAEIHSLLGFVELRLYPARPERAEASFRKALALDRDDLYGNYGFAKLLLRVGRFSESLPFFERAVTVAATYPQLRHDHGVALFRLGRLKEAWTEFRSSASLPSSVEYLALIEAKRERHTVAASLIKRLIDKLGPRSPKRPRLLYQMGAFLVMGSQNDAALAALAAAVEGGFEKVEALNELARMRYEKGEVDEAFAIWTRATRALSFRGKDEKLATEGRADARFQLGLVHFKQKEYAAARRELEAAIALRKYHPNAWYKYGQTLQRLKEGKRAREAFAFHRQVQPLHQQRKSAERSLVNDPSNLKNRFGYARILMALEEWPTAYDQLKILEQTRPDYPGLMNALVVASDKSGRAGEAEAYRRRTAASKPEGAEK